MPKGVPLTEEEQAARRHEIFDAAVSLFLDKGFQETSMREIAEAAKMGKSSLYDYFATKDDILLFLLEEETLGLTRRVEEIAALPLGAGERLARILRLHLEFLQAKKSLFVKLTFEAQRLKASSQKRIAERRYAYQDVVRTVIEDGIRAGEFRAVNPLLSARLLINSLVSVLFTTRPTGDVNEMLDETISIFLDGIKA